MSINNDDKIMMSIFAVMVGAVFGAVILGLYLRGVF